MEINEILGKRYKEKPNEAKLKSHEFLLRGAYIRPVSSGIFSILLPGLKVLKKIENIVREEINAVGGQEVEMPLVQPKELWQESGRYEAINDELVRFKDRNNHDNVLAMTHEEAAVALARNDATSYKDFPFSIYQFAKKFRDEARPRGGLIRVKEFTMKDAYSFHRDQESLDKTYAKYAGAYSRIFARAGIPEVLAIKSDSGMMGGNISHEYMLLTPSGEDTIITCSGCDYRANKEVATSKVNVANVAETIAPLERIYTPGIKTIEDLATFLNVSKERIAKTVVYKPVLSDTDTIIVMIRGDREVNENKLAKILHATPEYAGDDAFVNSGIVPGFASGYNARNARIIVDETLRAERNMIAGANELDWHLKNFNVSRDMHEVEFADVSAVQEGDRCPECGSPIKLKRGIEVGNIFQLGNKYTKPMNMTYIDENGKPQVPIMGCYGIGIGRLMASVAEVKHDERGPVWPVTIAPWEVSITTIKPKTPDLTVVDVARKIYTEMQVVGMDALFDGRDASAGEKFADIDLLGIPLQFIISPKTLEKGMAEWKIRATGERGEVQLTHVVQMAQRWLQEEKQKIMRVASECAEQSNAEFMVGLEKKNVFERAVNSLMFTKNR